MAQNSLKNILAGTGRSLSRRNRQTILAPISSISGLPSQVAQCSTLTSSSSTSKLRLEEKPLQLQVGNNAGFPRSQLHSSIKKTSESQRRSYSEKTTKLACPTCNTVLPASESTSTSTTQILSHCPACNAFLPPSEDIDYFDLFSLPAGYTVDKSQLRRSFLKWQGIVHPDRLSQSTSNSTQRQQQEDWANMWSSIVNEGYKTLSDERLRGEYILGKQGVAVREEDKMDDPELLMEIMEVREALEDAQTQEQVDEIRDNNSGRWPALSCR